MVRLHNVNKDCSENLRNIISPLIKENSACAAIAQANLYNNDLPARSKFILLTKLHDVTLVLIEIKCLYNNVYLDVKAHKKYYFKSDLLILFTIISFRYLSAFLNAFFCKIMSSIES